MSNDFHCRHTNLNPSAHANTVVECVATSRPNDCDAGTSLYYPSTHAWPVAQSEVGHQFQRAENGLGRRSFPSGHRIKFTREGRHHYLSGRYGRIEGAG